MSERPFMQLYVSDFVGDTLLLSTEHIGAYLLLLIALWNADGKLPADEVKLARVARLSVKKWRTVSTDLMPFFEIEGGVLTHHRLTKELQKSEAQSISRAIAGAKGGAANALKYHKPKEANASAGLKHARALPKPYRKEGDLLSQESGSRAESVVLDRWADEDLFHACEVVTGEPVKPYLQKQSFSAETIAKAAVLLTRPAEVGSPESEENAA